MTAFLASMVLIGVLALLVLVVFWVRTIRNFRIVAPKIDVPTMPRWIKDSSELEKEIVYNLLDGKLHPEVAGNWTPSDAPLLRTDGIFDWSLYKLKDHGLWVGRVTGKGRDEYVCHPNREKALSGLENALGQLRKEVM